MMVARIRARSQEAELRWSVRRDVSIATSARRDEDGYSALIRNLSENGLLIETQAPLGPRDTFEIALSEHDACVAEVVWVKGDLKGRRFLAPIPQAVVSAAVLRSPAEGPAQDIYDELRRARMTLDHEEQRHMPSTLSIPGLLLLLLFEALAVAMLIAGAA